MSEDPNQLSGEPEASGQPQGQPEAETPASAPQNEPEATPSTNQPQYPPPPEVYIQPEEVTSTPAAPQPQYPPTPGSYAQQPEQPSTPNPYAPQPQQPPFVQNPYATPGEGYGTPYFTPPPTYGYGYAQAQPEARPLPLGQAVRELPGQYWKILSKPGPRTFAAEQGKAEWGIIWIQLLFLMLFEAITALPIGLIEKSSFNATLTASGSAVLLDIPTSVFIIAITIGVIVFTPLVFFATVGVQWLVARAFKGTGWFKQQAYNQLLFQVPVTFITALLYLLITPFLSSVTAMMTITPGTTPNINPLALVISLIVELIASGVGIYGIVLNVFSIMAAQRLSGGKATGVVLIPYAAVIVLYLCCICALLATTMSSLPH